MLPLKVHRIGRWDEPLSALGHELQRVFERMGGNEFDTDVVGAYPVDMHEDVDNVYIDAELPGFKKDEINVTLENGILHIRAERKPPEAKGEKHLTERRFHRVQRSFTLPPSVDEAQIVAGLDAGVLHLTLAKKPEVKPHRIEVK